MKVFKRISLILFLLIGIAGGLIYAFRSKLIAKIVPEVEQIGDIYIELRDDTCFVKSRIVVRNKTFLKIEIDTIKYKILLFNKTFMENKKSLGILLPGNGTDTIDFLVQFPYVTLLKDLKSERKKDDSASYTINISLQYSTVFGKAEMPLNRSAKVKIPQPPEIEIVEIKRKKFRLKKILADVKIKIINHSPVTISINEMDYYMKIVNQGSVKGKFGRVIQIKPNETSYVQLPITIIPKHIGKTGIDVLKNKDNYNYLFELNAILESTDPLKKTFHINLIKEGVLELVK